MKTTMFLFFMLSALLFGACSDSDSPSPATVKMEMKATTTLSTISNSSGRSKATGLVFREILIGVTEIEFETMEEDQSEEEEDARDGEDGNGENENEEVEFEGQFIVDLINGTSTPDFGLADLAPGLYEEMEMELGPVLPNGNSLFVAVDFPRMGADTLKIEFSSIEEIELEIERDAGFRVDEGSLSQMLVLFDLDLLFAGVDFNQANVDPDGVVRINASSNVDILNLIESNLENALEAGEDEDGDDEIDEG